VYPIVDVSTNSSIAAQIFSPTGTSIYGEFKVSGSGVFTAPNVIVFSDNTFLVAWRDNAKNNILGIQCNSNGTPNTAVYILDHVSLPPSTPNEPFELLRVANDDYIIGYVCGTQLTYKHFAAKQTSTIYIMTNSAGTLTNPHATIIADQSGQVAYYIHERSTATTESFYVFRYVVADRNGPSMEVVFNNAVPSYPIPVVTTDQSVFSALFTNTPATGSRTIQHVTIDVPNYRVRGNYSIINGKTFNSDMGHAVHLGQDFILAAYTSDLGGTTNLVYRMTRVMNSGAYAAVYGPELVDSNANAEGPRMIVTGSDVVVIAKDRATGNIIRRVLTFCGNGIADAGEECDGTAFCNNECKCASGTSSVNGRCDAQCGDGAVLGSEECDGGEQCTQCYCNAGYKPYSPAQTGCQALPSGFVGTFGPVLDCITTTSTSHKLYFSFNNQDGFYQSIPQGEKNSISPSQYGTDRPSGFPAGQSLTYPSSPYILTVPSSLTAVSWQLNDKRLNIDLTQAQQFACPTSVKASIKIEAVTEINQEFVSELLANFAATYNISPERLTAAFEAVPTNRSLVTYGYIINTTIESDPAQSSSSAADALSNLIEDFKNSTTEQEVNDKLVSGLEENNPRVKEITPAPIDVRGTSYEPTVFLTPDVAAIPSGTVSSKPAYMIVISVTVASLMYIM
jgi:hypothetical protein